MIYITRLLIVLLCLVILLLQISNSKEKKLFNIKIDILQNIIIDLTKNLENKNNKVKISNETLLKMKESNEVFKKDFFELNMELFNLLYPKK